MRSFLVALVCLAVASELVSAVRLSQHEWTQFKRQYGKNYENQPEDARRFAKFMATKQRVQRHNAKADSSFKLGLNHMADWHEAELAKLNGFRLDADTLLAINLTESMAHVAKILASSQEPVPSELDWRQVPGRVGSVRNQGSCGSCWAFSAVGGLEGQELFKGTSSLIELSEQDLLDCSESNSGCMGGSMDKAYSDIGKLGGIMAEKDYAYSGIKHKCRFNKSKSQITDMGATFLVSKDEVNLKGVLAKFGPIPVAMNADMTMTSYKGGIIDNVSCGSEPEDLNHAILLVGYGTDAKHGDYWIVKNSWGKHWGENGYFRIKRGVNKCGIATYPIIPTF